MPNIEGKVKKILEENNTRGIKELQDLQEDLMKLHRQNLKQQQLIKAMQAELKVQTTSASEHYKDSCLEIERINKQLNYKADKLYQFNTEQVTVTDPKTNDVNFEQKC